MTMLEQLATSFIATAAFAILFNVPKGTLLQGGFVGMLGWALYLTFLEVPVDPIVATLLSSCFVAVVSQVFAKVYRTPVIVFSVSGIIPLVPGGMAYDAMRNAVENQYDLAVPLAAKAFMMSGAIAIGLVFSEVINHLIRRWRQG
ncbi:MULTISPECIES: threonine/serine exporter family protein [Paenibacillus]|uniref:threonine/serine exporter family protein n=1 Tax=Paenibacillus TaxID=44249 RepID=UPI0022B88964|nr:threonine/serine exporter family protein [Paenibacillus caseinilyticus]MCZ8522053.1 threonine/serine exporter family protein [Paenibacillus caseinilyticus]